MFLYLQKDKFLIKPCLKHIFYQPSKYRLYGCHENYGDYLSSQGMSQEEVGQRVNAYLNSVFNSLFTGKVHSALLELNGAKKKPAAKKKAAEKPASETPVEEKPAEEKTAEEKAE